MMTGLGIKIPGPAMGKTYVDLCFSTRCDPVRGLTVEAFSRILSTENVSSAFMSNSLITNKVNTKNINHINHQGIKIKLNNSKLTKSKHFQFSQSDVVGCRQVVVDVHSKCPFLTLDRVGHTLEGSSRKLSTSVHVVKIVVIAHGGILVRDSDDEVLLR